MSNIRKYSQAFNGGEMSPEFFGRLDDAKFQAGLALCRNFVVLPHGPIENRSGSQFVRAVKTEDKRTRLLPFTFSTDQTLVLEFGEGYFRFHTMGGTVMSGTAPYEVAHPYTESQLFEVSFAQDADVISLAHNQHPPRELRRLGPTNWQLVTETFGTSTPAPSNVLASAVVPPGTTNLRDYAYLVTGVRGAEESFLPPYSTCTNNLNQADTYNTVTWDAATGPVDGYNVYRLESGVFGFIGQASAGSLSLRDEGVMPDVSRTPPQHKNPFAMPGDYPAVVSYFEQRKVFAATINNPQGVWMTRTGTARNMDTSFPIRDDDAITFRISSRESNTVRHLVPIQDLLVMSQTGEWRLDGSVSPTSLRVKPQSFVGSSKVPPLLVNASMVFAAARGGHVRDLGYSNDAGGYTTGDLSLRAAHLFDGFQITDSAQSKGPVPVCWFTSSSGELLGLTYVPDQNIAAWHRHSTEGGSYESIAVVAEGEEDAIYVVVRREINGHARRYIERFHSRRVLRDDAADGFFVDAGVRYQGAPVSSLSGGLGHLEGCEVSILADGAVQPSAVVTSGYVSWPKAASNVVIGLPITAEAQTLPLAVEVQGYGQGRTKNVLEVWLRLFRSRGAWIGPIGGKAYEVKPRTDEAPGSPPALTTGEVSQKLQGRWSADGTVSITHREPLPLTVLSLTAETNVAG